MLPSVLVLPSDDESFFIGQTGESVVFALLVAREGWEVRYN